MCISTKALLSYGGNRCCKGKWQSSPKEAFDKHGFNVTDAEAWNKRCDATKCCAECGEGEPCYQKQLAELGNIPPCSTVVV